MKAIPAMCLGLAFAIGGAAAHALALREAAPHPALSTATDSRLDWSTLDGKVVLVDFWASWCGPCRQAFPAYDALQKRHADAGFVVLGINVDEQRKDADRFLRVVPVSFAIAFDPGGDAAKAFDVKAMPSSYLIGRDGRVRAVHLGFKPSDVEGFEAEVTAALAEKSP